MYDSSDSSNLNPDILTDDDMLALLHDYGDIYCETNAFGQDVTGPSHHAWMEDLIEVEKHLKALAQEPVFLDSKRLIRPVVFGSEVVQFTSDPLLDVLQAVYTTLATVFDPAEPMLYRPSPHAESFLGAFQPCAYLQAASFQSAPTMTHASAEQVVMDLNAQLGAWYGCLKQSSFSYRCRMNRRNSLANYRRLHDLIKALFDCYSRLQVLRVDLGYSADDGPWIDYDTARHHREQFCRLFHTHGLFTHMVGHAWKLEWRPKKGFHYHFLFFFNGHQVRKDVTLASHIGRLWAQQIAGGQGVYYNCNRNAGKVYHFNALGEVAYNDTQKRKGLDFIIRYLTKTDDYASMAVQGRTFQTSKAPSLPEGPRVGRPRQPLSPIFQPTFI